MEGWEQWPIVKVVRRGYMTKITLAQGPKGEKVAIKSATDNPKCSDSLIARFLDNETTALTLCRHPNLVRMVGMHGMGVRRRIALEWIDGDPLDEPNPTHGDFTLLPEQTRIYLLRQIFEAVEAVHAQGLLHCDLQGGNVLLTPSSQDKGWSVRVIDFGLSRKKNICIPGFGTDGGTPGYRAPEQVQCLNVDERTDVYALGCIVYLLMTGEEAFSGHPDDDWQRVYREIPPAFTGIEWADQLIRKATRRWPEDRFQTVQDMRAALPSF